MPLDLSRDHLILDGLEDVIYTSKTVDGDTAFTVEDACGLMIPRREVLASAGMYSGRERVWHVPDSEMTADPKEGDVITEGSATQWYVLEAEHILLENHWRLITRREREPLAILHECYGYWQLGEASGTRADTYLDNDLDDNNTVTQAVGKVGNAAQFTAA